MAKLEKKNYLFEFIIPEEMQVDHGSERVAIGVWGGSGGRGIKFHAYVGNRKREQDMGPCYKTQSTSNNILSSNNVLSSLRFDHLKFYNLWR